MTALHVVAEGRGPALVTVHGGLGLDHSYLRRGLAPLADRFTLLHVDLPGHGGSPPPADWAGEDLDGWADDLDAVRAARGLDRWHVLGHSYGGFIALAYALRHPARVDRLVLASAGPSFAHAPSVLGGLEGRGQPEAAQALLQAFSAPVGDDPAAFAADWARVLPLYFHRWAPRHLEAFAGTGYCPAGFNRGNQLLATADFTPRLGEVGAPTLVVGGDDDFIMPAAGPGAALASGIPGARQVVVPGAGHFPMLEQPDPTADAIAAFLSAR